MKEACYILNRRDLSVFYFCVESTEQTPKKCGFSSEVDYMICCKDYFKVFLCLALMLLQCDWNSTYGFLYATE